MYETHPIADAFPMMEPERFQELVASIREFGLQEEIVLFEGKILDGRNRYRACLEAGIQPDFIQFDGDLSDAVAHVRIHNLLRRDLSDSQRSMVRVNLEILEGREPTTAQLEAMAKEVGVSPRTVSYAKTVAQSGNKSLIKAVEDGAMSVSRAAHVVAGRLAPSEAMMDGRSRNRAGRPPGSRDANKVLRGIGFIIEADMTKAARGMKDVPEARARIAQAARALQYLVDLMPASVEVEYARTGT